MKRQEGRAKLQASLISLYGTRRIQKKATYSRSDSRQAGLRKDRKTAQWTMISLRKERRGSEASDHVPYLVQLDIPALFININACFNRALIEIL